MSHTTTGTVTGFDAAKGFGVIAQPSGPDVFAHFSTIVRAGFKTLMEGPQADYIVAC